MLKNGGFCVPLLCCLWAALSGCQRAGWDAAQGRQHLLRAGYQVGAATPDPLVKSATGATSGECFDVKKDGAASKVCVWTCPQTEACSRLVVPPQRTTLPNIVTHHAVFIEGIDQQASQALLRAMNP